MNKNRNLARSQLGVCPQFDACDTLTVKQQLLFYARVRGVANPSHNTEELIRAFGLETFRDRLAQKVSHGTSGQPLPLLQGFKNPRAISQQHPLHNITQHLPRPPPPRTKTNPSPPLSSPAAPSANSPSPSPSSATPPSSSSTNPPAVSTPPPNALCGAPSPPSPRTAAPCSQRTAWKKPTRSRTALASWPGAC